MTETETTPAETIAAAIAALGLTVESQFVPFSQSRNKAEKSPSLNWRVTLKRNGREVLTTDYSAGCGHCPAKATAAPAGWRAPDRYNPSGKPYPGTSSNYRRATAGETLAHFLAAWRAAECERGLALEYSPIFGSEDFKPKRKRKPGDVSSQTIPILPKPEDVIYALMTDADVLDAGGFEEWAGDLGYDTDSRQAESTYRACLEIALKLRAGLGDSGLSTLRDAFADY